MLWNEWLSQYNDWLWNVSSRNWDPISGRDFSTKHLDQLWAPPQVSTGTLSLGVKQPRWDAEHSPPSSAQFKSYALLAQPCAKVMPPLCSSTTQMTQDSEFHLGHIHYILLRLQWYSYYSSLKYSQKQHIYLWRELNTVNVLLSLRFKTTRHIKVGQTVEWTLWHNEFQKQSFVLPVIFNVKNNVFISRMHWVVTDKYQS